MLFAVKNWPKFYLFIFSYKLEVLIKKKKNILKVPSLDGRAPVNMLISTYYVSINFYITSLMLASFIAVSIIILNRVADKASPCLTPSSLKITFTYFSFFLLFVALSCRKASYYLYYLPLSHFALDSGLLSPFHTLCQTIHILWQSIFLLCFFVF